MNADIKTPFVLETAKVRLHNWDELKEYVQKLMGDATTVWGVDHSENDE